MPSFAHLSSVRSTSCGLTSIGWRAFWGWAGKLVAERPVRVGELIVGRVPHLSRCEQRHGRRHGAQWRHPIARDHCRTEDASPGRRRREGGLVRTPADNRETRTHAAVGVSHDTDIASVSYLIAYPPK
jgi:hypothetical protein